jgi:predicted kinase
MELIKYKEDDLVLDIDEGVNDPGIFKAIILAGGPGSGKSWVAKQLGLKSLGLIVVNSDNYFEMLMKRKGLSLKMPDSEADDREVARMAAKGSTDKRYKSLIAARLGILIDSTSGDQAKTFRMYRELTDWGYDVKAIFIDTDIEVALQRNTERARTVPEKVVRASHKAAKNVKDMLKKKLGRDYHEITNNGGPIDTSVSGKLTTWARKPNSTAIEWIAAVKRGNNSPVKEDINISMIQRFKEYTSWR